MIAIDFFSGAGGLTKGLTQAGINVLLGIDNDPNCKDTYEYNNPLSRFLLRDISSMNIGDLEQYIRDLDSSKILFAACAPCQPFTKLNNIKKRGKLSLLLGAFKRFILAYQPGYILIENVPGIAKVPGNSTFRRLLNQIDQIGYKYSIAVLDAKNFGVPQTRRRLILIAAKQTTPNIPFPTHGPGLLPYRTVKNAIERFPPILAGETHPSVSNHRSSELSVVNLTRINLTPKDGGDRRSWPKELWLDCHNNGHSGHTDVYGRMWWDRPSPSITCRCDSLSNGRFGHPEQNRAISLREAASLQGFPDDYIFLGDTKLSVASQIGNALPVPLAEILGKHILQLDKNIRS